MSKKIVNELKTQVKKSEYTNLRPAKETLGSGDRTYLDMNFNGEYEFARDFVINGKVVTSDYVNNLYPKHKNLILKDEKGKENYRLFLKAAFTEMFWRAGAKIPNNSIMEELITYLTGLGI
ncbi:hypothetical protein [Wolbachia endosymbiont of Ctenocephalides felis wCfeJ]|uniref:hypothetical protein n=1 Tax=Wolbachia endosymbiont of Ctenocephalides felis wCfeJ TaxID=2732594 RepID=UPI00350E9C16|nr:MAG: hypothetical protein PG980_000877 [Wolbachia endosymbiont of Ctenocephalides felis wCfeJ]